MKVTMSKTKRIHIQALLILLMGAFFLVGCATSAKYSAAVSTWVGSHISDVKRSWGPETDVTSDGNGGRIYSWTKRWKTRAYYNSSGVYQPPRDRHCTRNLYCNQSGKVYSWRWNGYCKSK